MMGKEDTPTTYTLTTRTPTGRVATLVINTKPIQKGRRSRMKICAHAILVVTRPSTIEERTINVIRNPQQMLHVWLDRQGEPHVTPTVQIDDEARLRLEHNGEFNMHPRLKEAQQ